MIPLSLSIQGLYSYKEKQTIDFENLTSHGLFGIFGKVGSGKSSILEAIMFVLYDDTERLNKSGDDRYYNMLNLQSSRFSIDFTFKAGKGNQEKFRFSCTAKRNTNPEKFEDVKISRSDRQFYKWDDAGWVPLEGVKDATEILGMDYKNFKQTIIIPQGKFREFVDQTSGDRTRMLKELFRLHSFDLGPQTGKLQKETEMKIQHLQGQLESLGECQPEKITALTEQIASLEKGIKEISERLISEKKQEQEFQQLQTLNQQLTECRQQLQKLEGEKSHWEQRAEQLKTYSDAYTHFFEKLRLQKTLGQELKEKEKLQQEIKEKLQLNKDRQKKAEEAFEKAREEYAKKEQIQRKIEDLERIIRIKGTEVKLEEERKKQQKLEASCKKSEESSLKAKEEYRQMETRLHKLETEQADISRLSEAYQWLTKKEDLQAQLQKAENNLAECREELAGSLEQRNKLLKDWPALAIDADWPDLFDGLERIRKKCAEEESGEHKKLAELQVQQKLSEYAGSLQDGHPCPLCGAEDHPRPAVSKHIQQACQEQEQKIKVLKEKLDRLNSLRANMKELQADLRHLEQNRKQQQGQVLEYQKQQQSHQQIFTWAEYRNTPKAELKRQIDLTRLAHEQMKAFRVQLQAAKKEADSKATRFETQGKELQLAERNLSEQEGILKAQKEALHIDNHRLLKFESSALEESFQKGKEKLHLVVKEYEESQQQLNQLKEGVSALQERSKNADQYVEELRNKLSHQQEEIQDLCKSKGFENAEKVRDVLKLQLNMEQEDRLINAYRQRLHTTRDQLQKLEQQANGREYKQEEHLSLKTQINEGEQQCEEKKSSKSKAEHQKAELAEKLARSQNLLKELEELELRKENLKELAGLFRGSGFVDYVSTIYLQDLCRVANERFFKLTRNNLSLELNDQNNFIVRDYLNGGRTRLLKTLSGGQTFQAALCLALAMAENIKSLNEAEQSFFFLDEGFGALDRESLRIVFDTLKSLRQENRIVGVISHVEELQQEIELYLNVENDGDKGSLVKCSWE